MSFSISFILSRTKRVSFILKSHTYYIYLTAIHELLRVALISVSLMLCTVQSLYVSTEMRLHTLIIVVSVQHPSIFYTRCLGSPGSVGAYPSQRRETPWTGGQSITGPAMIVRSDIWGTSCLLTRENSQVLCSFIWAFTQHFLLNLKE